MRLGGRLAAAIEVMDDIERRHRPAADALRDWGLSHRFAGAGDRAAIGNMVYDALRRKRSAGWLLETDTSRAVVVGALVIETGMEPAAINDALDGDRFAPEPLSAAEIEALGRHWIEDAPAAIRADCPDWCVPLLEASYGDDWTTEASALAARPPLDLRVNTLKADRSRVLDELRGADTAPTRIATHGLRIPPIQGFCRHPNVQAEPAFQKGWFEVQDEGSQVAAELAGAHAGMQVLDYCAGAGGKTLALAASMENRGQIFAHDSDKQRLSPIFDRIRRAETRNVQVTARADELAPLAGQMDLVLVDAPCTGSGTWRRRPDAKWRLRQGQLEARMAEQNGILDAAKAYVKPGGRLAYVTCSVFAGENRDRVADFLARSRDFGPADNGALWEARFPGKADLARIDAAGGIMLGPGRSGTDGFYFCMLQRAN